MGKTTVVCDSFIQDDHRMHKKLEKKKKSVIAHNIAHKDVFVSYLLLSDKTIL
jgi:hypothetical protein